MHDQNPRVQKPRVLADVPDGRCVVIEASAGTGKTYTITRWVADLVLRGAARIDEILVVTFTLKAAGELRDRLRATLAGLAALDPAFVCVVVIEDPRIPGVKHQGGMIAAPIFGKIATRVATHMNLQPTEPLTRPIATAAR